ncbi:MAG: hypothetical protein ABWK00_01480 [Desulfurococcaceae archaeon]
MGLGARAIRSASGVCSSVAELGGRASVLNDVATALYGIMRPVEEVRIVVGGLGPGEAAEAVASALGMEAFVAEISERLSSVGIVALNPVFSPLVVVELARGELDELLLEHSPEVEVLGAGLAIPELEFLIARLASMGSYPHAALAAALQVAWDGLLRHDLLSQLLDLAGRREEHAGLVEDVRRLASALGII